MKKIIALAIIIVCAVMVVPDCHAQQKKKDYPLSLKDLFKETGFGWNSPVEKFKRLSPQQKTDNIIFLIDEIEESCQSATNVDDLYDLREYTMLLDRIIVSFDLSHSRKLSLKYNYLCDKIDKLIKNCDSSSVVEATE